MFIKYDLNIIIINFPDIYKILSGKFWLGGRTNQIGSSYIYIYIYIYNIAQVSAFLKIVRVKGWFRVLYIVWD